jgi:hypothetical protein
VYGGTYILGDMARIKSGKQTEDGVEIQIEAQEGALRGKRLIGTDKALREAGLLDASGDGRGPRRKIEESEPRRSNCVAIVSGPPPMVRSAFSSGRDGAQQTEEQEDEDEVAGNDVLVLVVPAPEGQEEGQEVSRILFMGSGTGSCPEGECELHVVGLEVPVGTLAQLNGNDNVFADVVYISTPTKTGETNPAKALLDRLFVTPTSTTLPTNGTDQIPAVPARPLFIACYEDESPYDLTDRPAGSASASASTGRLISLDDTVRTRLRAGGAVSSGSQWLEGMDLEAELAQAVLDDLGIEMINKREEGEGGEDGEL